METILKILPVLWLSRIVQPLFLILLTFWQYQSQLMFSFTRSETKPTDQKSARNIGNIEVCCITFKEESYEVA